MRLSSRTLLALGSRLGGPIRFAAVVNYDTNQRAGCTGTNRRATRENPGIRTRTFALLHRAVQLFDRVSLTERELTEQPPRHENQRTVVDRRLPAFAVERDREDVAVQGVVAGNCPAADFDGDVSVQRDYSLRQSLQSPHAAQDVPARKAEHPTSYRGGGGAHRRNARVRMNAQAAIAAAPMNMRLAGAARAALTVNSGTRGSPS
jgi:hypothetical protein